MWVMGEWAVGHWIVGILSFQKIYGLYGLKHHTVDLLSCIVDPDFSCVQADGRTNGGIPRGPHGPKKQQYCCNAECIDCSRKEACEWNAMHAGGDWNGCRAEVGIT